VETLYAEPGPPGRLSRTVLQLSVRRTTHEDLTDLAEARYLANTWPLEYKHRWPRDSLGYRPVFEFAANCVATGSATCSRSTRWQAGARGGSNRRSIADECSKM